MRFEWDEEKRRTNLTRHGFDFEQAEKVFASVSHTFSDDRFDYGERRFMTYGLLEGEVIAIAHTESEDSKIIRIISMRKATKYEEISFFKETWG